MKALIKKSAVTGFILGITNIVVHLERLVDIGALLYHFADAFVFAFCIMFICMLLKTYIGKNKKKCD